MPRTVRNGPEGRRRVEIGSYIHFYKKYDKKIYKFFFREKRFLGHKNRSRRAPEPREGPAKNDQNSKNIQFL